MRCNECGRFMKRGGFYTNEHADSWEETWSCGGPHGDLVAAVVEANMPGRNDG